MTTIAQPRFLLSLETTCDETGAAVLEQTARPVPIIRSNVVASQIASHLRFGGVVPEVAAREHVRLILPVVSEALGRAGITLEQLDAVAVASGPGLVGALVVGLTVAKALALALGVPLVAYDHLEGHLYACQLSVPDSDIYPCIGLVVSGGHTSLYSCHGPLDAEFLGGTRDDAAGEAFDKVSNLLGLGYPGGPAIETAAAGGNPLAFAFPRAFLRDDRIEFSFSGLKTAVLYALRGQDSRGDSPNPSPQVIRDLAASFQRAVVDVIVAKCGQALAMTGLKRLAIGGGVAANSELRTTLETMCGDLGAALFRPTPDLCTDNAALGGIALVKLMAGQTSPLDIDVNAGLQRPGKPTQKMR